MSDTALIEDLYNRRILELAAGIPRIGRLDSPQASAVKVSRLCGSRVDVDLNMAGGKVSDFAHEVRACLLGQAASSIMARNVIGARAAELRDLAETMRKMLREGGPPPGGKWKDLEILQPVRDYKARHASTLLTFEAVEDCLGQIEGEKK